MALLAIGQHKRLAAMHAILCLHLGLKVVRRNGVATMTTVVFCRLLASVVLRAFALRARIAAMPLRSGEHFKYQ